MIVALFLLVAQDVPKGPPGPDEIDTRPRAAAPLRATANDTGGTTSWSIAPPDPCAGQRAADHITVCGVSVEESQRGVFRGTGVARHASTPSNPDVRGIDALQLVAPPCAARMGGCQTGVDFLGAAAVAINLVRKIIDPDSCCDEPGQAKNFFKLVGDSVGGITKKREGKDQRERTAIDLSEPQPQPRATGPRGD